MSEERVSPAVEFGKEIRIAREARGWSQAELAHRMHFQQPYVSKVETGQQLASPQFAEQCDRVFGTPGVYARMRQKAADAGSPVWFIPYLELEREALAVCDYSSVTVTGILQTPEYAEAIFRSAHPLESTEQIDVRVAQRMRRRELFDKPNPPRMWVILHESVLWADRGGPEVMREQLRFLAGVTESPNVMLQVFPFGAGTPARGLPFSVVTRRNGTEVLYEENYTRGQVTDSVNVVAEARDAYERLRADALSPDRSLSLIRNVMEARRHENQPRPTLGVDQVESQRGQRRHVRRVGPRVHLRGRPNPR
ncbi:helix-turn-helix transcriptional regulator [Streptomyces sp. AV19]|uniref:helix-turn-helix domain-containing protein n=1 Tax=Streptomyces sp. AV19 TaxID=2793068 RepID=UPI001F1EA1F9|nr:helix-turn-helix transcriptional regulator [Streptomyces sp. AV19]MDG4536735.1 helix-turn-helix transcriptional regulator [Streptomyces sp. AV19]